MTPCFVRSVSIAPILFVLTLGGGAALAQTSREAIRPATTKADPRRATKGPLPDPALLDGAQHPPEKRSEHGMIGDFELPGDENVRDDRVGGQQNPAGAGQEQEDQQQQGQGGGPPAPEVEQAQVAGGGEQQQQEQQQQQGGGGPDGAGQIPGQGNPIAMAEGIQVASLQGEGGGNPGDVPAGQKPSQVTIGDSAMQIKTQPNAPTTVGAQQTAGKTQQHEKETGTGGRPPTGNNTNRGAERGRAMPAGL